MCRRFGGTPRVQQTLNRRPVGRTAAGVNESDDTGGVDQDIASCLMRIGVRSPRKVAPQDLAEVEGDGGRLGQLPPRQPSQAVGFVESPVRVRQHWPGRSRFGRIGARRRFAFKRHDTDTDPQLAQQAFSLLQLQQVPAAGESPKVAMQDKQQPFAPVVFQAVLPPVTTRQIEGRRPHPGSADNHRERS